MQGTFISRPTSNPIQICHPWHREYESQTCSILLEAPLISATPPSIFVPFPSDPLFSVPSVVVGPPETSELGGGPLAGTVSPFHLHAEAKTK